MLVGAAAGGDGIGAALGWQLMIAVLEAILKQPCAAGLSRCCNNYAITG